MDVEKIIDNFPKEDFPREHAQNIVIATSSARKALMAMYIIRMLNDLEANPESEIAINQHFPVQSAEELSLWLNQHVRNGDGSLPQETTLFIGQYRSIFFWIVSTQGETQENDNPVQQAKNKALFVAQKFALLNINAVVVGTDTVDKVCVGGNEQYCGKPVNDSVFPQKTQEESQEEYENNVKSFLLQYLSLNYPVGAEIHNINAMAILQVIAGQILFNRILSGKVEYSYTVPEQIPSDIVPEPESGGGGLTQQFIIRSEQFKELSELDRWLLLCQLSGMPFMAIYRLVENFSG